MNAKRWLLSIFGVGCLLALASALYAADEPKEPQPAKTDQLAIQQGVVADKYAKLEKLLDDMARIEGLSNPRRAALLMQALKQSKENLTTVKLDACVKLLNQQQLNRALENQRDAQKDMAALLELLLSENRSDRLKREQDRIREYIKEVERILRLQKSVQGRTEGGGEPKELAQDQNKVADRTGELAKRIQQNEEGGADASKQAQPGANGEQPPSGDPQAKPEDEPKAQDGSKSEPKDAQGTGKKENDAQGAEKTEPKKPNEGPAKEPSQGGEQGQAKDQNQGDSSGQKQEQGKPQPGQGQSQEGQPQDDQQGNPQEQSKQEQANPARKRIEAAEQRMRDAQKRLEEAKQKDAVAEQEKAKEELEKAKAELERILRQLREEEVERALALLEGRFRKMLEMQIRIYEDTVRLDKSDDEIRKQKESGRLGSEERKLVVEADKALNLLLEEGSSIAFPETVTQMRDDMQQVAERLDAANVGKITQGTEEDIIAALEEMIEALQKAQKDLEKQKQQQQMMPMDPSDMPLVDAMSELKMIRALQMRVNTRTQRYSRLLDNADDPVGQATAKELVDALSKLAERQENIYRITRDLVLGKNR
jgi:hypothetical protein